MLASLSAFGLLFGAWYLLTLLRRVFFGAPKEPTHEGHGPVPDLSYRELAALVPVAAMCLIIGVFPQPFLDIAKPEVQGVARIADKARERASDRQALERSTGEEHARGGASTGEDGR